MGCFPSCFGHQKQKQTNRLVQHQTLSPRDELLQEAAIMLGASTQCCINEEEIARVIEHVSQYHAEPEEQKKGCCQGKISNSSNKEDAGIGDNEGNGRSENKTDKGNEDETLVQDPAAAANNGLEVFSAIDSECPLAATPAKPEEKGNHENKRESGNKNETLEPDPAANSGCKDLLAIDEECELAAAPVKIEEKINLEDHNVVLNCSSSPVQMESSESLFSLSIDSRKYASAADIEDKEVSSALKPLMNSDKENENVNLEEKCREAPVKQSGSKLNEVAMDTSLSSWLAGSEKACDTSNGSSPESQKNYGGRQILGMITINHASELKQMKGGCSPDDQLRFGTVGRYWKIARQV